MTNYQNAVLSAYEKMLIECDKAPAAVAKIPVFGKKIIRVRELVTEIKSLIPQQEEITTGITTEKNALLEDVAELVLDIVGAVHAYAEERKDINLQEKVSYNRTQVHHEDQAGLIHIADIVMAQVQKIPAADLEECGIAADEVQECTDKLAKLKTSVNDKNIVSIDQSNITKRIGSLFGELADIRHNSLDKLIRQFERKDPDFYFKFKAASVIHYSPAKKAAPTPTA
ncbi:MAG: hypothetical protein PHR83_08640 [Paludibacter sp.]|nr:hypothetical protein [Paludibacter sp.]